MRAGSITSCLPRQDFVSVPAKAGLCIRLGKWFPMFTDLWEVGHAISYTAHREHGLVAPLWASAFQLLVALLQLTHCVGHGVLAALDVRT